MTLTVKTFLPDGKKLQHFTAKDEADAIARIAASTGYDGPFRVRIEDENGSGAWMMVSSKDSKQVLCKSCCVGVLTTDPYCKECHGTGVVNHSSAESR